MALLKYYHIMRLQAIVKKIMPIEHGAVLVQLNLKLPNGKGYPDVR